MALQGVGCVVCRFFHPMATRAKWVLLTANLATYGMMSNGSPSVGLHATHQRRTVQAQKNAPLQLQRGVDVYRWWCGSLGDRQVIAQG